MRIRGVKREDVEKIDEIYRRHHEDNFALPSLNNTVTSAVIVDDENKVIGFGVVKILAEAIMMLDLNQSKVERLEALTMLMTEAERGCLEAGITQLHVFVKDPKLVALLQRKWDFKVVNDTTMVKEI